MNKGELTRYTTAIQSVKNTTAIENEVFDNFKYCPELIKHWALLSYLIKCKAYPTKTCEDKHHTRTYWYEQKGKIVASISIKRLSGVFGVSYRMMRYWINGLVKCGVIERILEKRENVFILGEIKNGKEYFFYSDPNRFKPKTTTVIMINKPLKNPWSHIDANDMWKIIEENK